MSKYLTLFVRIWKLFKPFHKVFYSLLIVACIIGALEIYNTSNLGNVVTAVSEKDLSKTYTAFIIYAIFLSFYWTFDFIYDYVLRMYFSRKTYYFLREHSIKEVLKFTRLTLTRNDNLRLKCTI